MDLLKIGTVVPASCRTYRIGFSLVLGQAILHLYRNPKMRNRRRKRVRPRRIWHEDRSGREMRRTQK